VPKRAVQKWIGQDLPKRAGHKGVGIEAKIFGQAKVLKDSLNNQLQKINTD
jgi:hypothetical protein